MKISNFIPGLLLQTVMRGKWLMLMLGTANGPQLIADDIQPPSEIPSEELLLFLGEFEPSDDVWIDEAMNGSSEPQADVTKIDAADKEGLHEND